MRVDIRDKIVYTGTVEFDSSRENYTLISKDEFKPSDSTKLKSEEIPSKKMLQNEILTKYQKIQIGEKPEKKQISFSFKFEFTFPLIERIPYSGINFAVINRLSSTDREFIFKYLGISLEANWDNSDAGILIYKKWVDTILNEMGRILGIRDNEQQIEYDSKFCEQKIMEETAEAYNSSKLYFFIEDFSYLKNSNIELDLITFVCTFFH